MNQADSAAKARPEQRLRRPLFWGARSEKQGAGIIHASRSPLHATLLWLLVVALTASLLPARAANAAPLSQDPVAQEPVAQETAADCADLSEEQLRDELNATAQPVFTESATEQSAGQTPVDIAAIVQRQWRLLGMDAALDAQVESAITQVRGNATLWDTFLSGWSGSKAEELTRQVAALTFGSETLTAKLEELSAAVAAEAAEELALLSAESASLATICLQQYIGARYSETIVGVFTRRLQVKTDALGLDVDESLNNGLLAVIDQHKMALGGIGVIIAAQIAKRIAVRLGQTIAKRVAGRIVGRVLGRAGSTVIPAVGWVVGAGMIVYDLIESRDGALPQIRDALQSEETKETLRAEITAEVEHEIRLQAPQIARDVANDLYAEWLEFQRQYRQVLALADEEPAFRDLLEKAEEPSVLTGLVDAVLATGGRDGLKAALDDGSLERAMALPAAAQTMAHDTGSLATVLTWADLAGSSLEDVARLEIHKHKTPDALTRDQLSRLIALDEKAAVAKLVLLEGDALDRLLRLSTETLKQAAFALSADDLRLLAGYLATLTQDQANALLVYVLAHPEAMQTLADERLQTWLAASDNVPRDLAFLAAPVDIAGFGDHLLKLVLREVPFGLFVAKYGIAVSVAAMFLPLLLLLALAYSLLMWLLAPFAGLFRLVRRATPQGRR